MTFSIEISKREKNCCLCARSISLTAFFSISQRRYYFYFSIWILFFLLFLMFFFTFPPQTTSCFMFVHLMLLISLLLEDNTLLFKYFVYLISLILILGTIQQQNSLSMKLLKTCYNDNCVLCKQKKNYTITHVTR